MQMCIASSFSACVLLFLVIAQAGVDTVEKDSPELQDSFSTGHDAKSMAESVLA